MREEYDIDGVRYFITAVEYSAGFYGNWVCDECGEAGTHPQPHATPEEALSHAKQHLLEHHNSRHKPPASQPPQGVSD